MKECHHQITDQYFLSAISLLPFHKQTIRSNNGFFDVERSFVIIERIHCFILLYNSSNVKSGLFHALEVMRRSLKQLVPVVFMIAILRETDSSLSFADGCNQTNAAAQQIAHRLHEVFEKNLGFNRLQSLYDSLSCVNQTTDVKRLLNSITDPAAARLNASVKFLQELSATLHQLSSKTHHENVTECCKYLNGTSVTTFFSERLRSLVDTTTGCSIKHSALSGERESFILNAELSKRFKDNFKGSPVVAWQYYGSIDGEYVQYPGNTRHCEGTSSAQFDPRFK